MSEEDPEAHRPRRGRRDPSMPAESTTPDTDPGPPTCAGDGDGSFDGQLDDADSEDTQKPLYRDEGSAAGTGTPDLSDETTILSRARERKRSRQQRDPDETTLLPRTAGGGRVRRRTQDDDVDDDVEADPSADRRRLLLMIGAVAVVAILGLLAGYAIIKSTTQPVAGPGPNGGTTDASTSPSDGASTTDNTALITDEMMLSPAQAETLDKKRTWEVALTQRGTSTDSANHAACLSAETTEGAPVPQQTVLRVLSSSGSDAPAALHQATLYSSPEEAAQAYADSSRALGDCATSGAWIYQGHTVGGVGDQAVGVTIQVLDGKSEEFRTVVLARTGRILDVIDVAKPDRAVTAKRVAEVTGDVVDTQCQVAGGSCSDEPEAQPGPPPMGGDQPGFLASGDLPPMGPELTRWAGTTPGQPDPDQLRGSGCETVDWSKVDAESASHRTYLLSDGNNRFGLDEVIVTTENEAAARKLAEKVRDGWKNCHQRQLTATVANLEAVSGPGAKSVDVQGWTTEVSQKLEDKTNRYRVGIVTAGPKVVFVFMNPQDNLDLTDDQFDIVAVRAGQRASQVN